MTATIRRATPGDADALSLVAGAAFLETFAHDHPGAAIVTHARDTYAPARFAALATDEGHDLHVVAEAAGAIVGYALGGPPTLPGAQPGDYELKRLYLLWRWHGTGTGLALYDAMVGDARTRGSGRMLLSVYEHNHKAQRFYAREGFVAIGDHQYPTADFASRDLVLARSL